MDIKRTSLNGVSHECNESLGVLLRLRGGDPVHVGSVLDCLRRLGGHLLDACNERGVTDDCVRQ